MRGPPGSAAGSARPYWARQRTNCRTAAEDHDGTAVCEWKWSEPAHGGTGVGLAHPRGWDDSNRCLNNNRCLNSNRCPNSDSGGSRGADRPLRQLTESRRRCGLSKSRGGVSALPCAFQKNTRAASPAIFCFQWFKARCLRRLRENALRGARSRDGVGLAPCPHGGSSFASTYRIPSGKTESTIAVPSPSRVPRCRS